MLQIQGSSSRLRELSIAVILSTLFCQFGFLVLFFTVPLYALFYRRGATDLLIGSGSVLFLILVFAVWKMRSVSDADLRGALVIIEMIIPILLMLGMFFVIDIIPGFSGVRRLYRLLTATCAAAIICVPVFLLLKGNDVFTEAVKTQINALAGIVMGDGSGTYESEVVKSYLGEEGLAGYMKNFYMKSAAAMYFLILLVTVRISELLVSRIKRQTPLMLVDFSVPNVLLWPMLLAAVGMLVDIFNLLELGFAVPVVWNAGLILLFIYGLQGLGIIRAVFRRFKLPQSLRMMFEFILIMMLLMPGINYIVIIGLPVLGISETWINLRKSIRST